MRLTAHDASFLYAETSRAPMHAASISVVDGEVSLAAVREQVASRLHLAPGLRQRLVMSPFNLAHPKWVDDPDFCIDHHVRAHALTPGVDLDSAIKAAVVLAEPLLPRNRPLWLTWVISGVPERTILLQMVHHAMVDGASGVDLSRILLDLQPEPAKPEPAPDWQPEPLPDSATLIGEALQEQMTDAAAGLARGLRGWQQHGQEMMRRAGESITRFTAEPVMMAPWNAGLVGPKRQLAWLRYGFAEFRDIRRAFGGTINDVVLTLVAEAAARYLAEHKQATRGQHLRLMCPVNVRREEDAGALGNRVSGVFPIFSVVPMPVADRYRAVRREMEQIKQSQEAQALALMMEMSPSPPPVLFGASQLVGTIWDPTAIAAELPAPKLPPGPLPLPLAGFNFTCTNVPGVQVAQYIAGAKVLDMLPLLMLGGQLGYGVAVMSYNRQIYFSLICDPGLMPDLPLMAQKLDEVFQALRQAAGSEQEQ